jgi:FkbM family methyltransferase
MSMQSLQPYFDKTPVKGVIHVGAHLAEELESYNKCGIYRVIWIEANTKLRGPLLDRISNHESLGLSAFFYAAYNVDDDWVTLNISNNGQSSSLLELDTHKEEYPNVEYVDEVVVPTCRIDSLMVAKGFNRDCYNFLNIDIQGSEILALRGVTRQLQHVDYVYIEVNEKHLYKDCPLIDEVDEFLSSYKFHREKTHMTTKGWGDAFYIKKERNEDTRGNERERST